jgi:glucose dehydrogenase
MRYICLAILMLTPVCGYSQTKGQAKTQAKKDTGADWPTYNRDLGGSRYSPLTQITARNVANLKQAWTYKLQSDAPPAAGRGRGGGAGGNSEATPIVVNGVMYLPAASKVVALEPDTGKEIWHYDVTGSAPSRRGVAYWPGDRDNPPRIIFTAGRRLIGLNAAKGTVDPGFGKEGEVDMTVAYNSVPTIFKNIVMVGANPGGTPIGPPGDGRAYDARTGVKLWDFHSVPQPGELGHDTWAGDSWKNRSGTNVWGFYETVDEERGIVYLPVAAPSANYYGGDRKGANLFGNAVVAVDAATGQYKWHFQTIHHDLWDADPPAAPGLIDIVRNGQKIPALAQVTKSGWMFILDRVTGKPVFGVEERAVPKSDVPGEESWPTQPFPLKPPPLARVSMKPEDLVTAADTTPEHAKACQELVEKNGGLNNAGPYTPWPFRPEGAPVKAALLFPGGTGGANWGGTAADPKSGFVYVMAMDDGVFGWVEKTTKAGAPLPYDKTALEGGRGNFDVRVVAGPNWPCQKPPWGRLTAVNANTGDIAWQIPLGITEELPPAKQNTGRTGLAGPIVTASGLLFIGATNDNRFRALDSKTGKELWVAKLERTANATPMTYQARNGKQYVAVSASDTLVVFALP